MKSQKPKLTPEELSRVRSEAARKGIAKRKALGYAMVGRKKGNPNNGIPIAREPSRTLSVRQPDYDVFVRCANAADKPIVSFMHDVAESLKKKNPILFTPDAQEVRL